jgi:hypothetical protein
MCAVPGLFGEREEAEGSEEAQSISELIRSKNCKHLTYGPTETTSYYKRHELTATNTLC